MTLSGLRKDAQCIRDEIERMTAFLRVANAKEENDPEIQVWHIVNTRFGSAVQKFTLKPPVFMTQT